MAATGRDIRLALGEQTSAALRQTQTEVLAMAEAAAAAGAANLAAARAPIIALGVLRSHLIGTTADTDGTRPAIRSLSDALLDTEQALGGAGRGAKALSESLKELACTQRLNVSIAEQFQSASANTFAAIVSGSSRARQAVAGLLQQMSQMLANRAFMSLTSSLFPSMGAVTVPSFAGGGYTGMGARVGGLDGMGSFPAILHPNETVIDHTKGGGHVAEVRLVVEEAPGFASRVQAMSGDMAVQVVREYDRSALPGRVGQISRDPRRRG
ncbi:MAG: hypothetical protein ACXIUV_02795 [Alkalilacustris sp.]